MRAVIVLFTVFIQVFNIALSDDVQPQFLQIVPQQFFLPGCFPKPGYPNLPSPPGRPKLPQPPLPPCPCCAGPPGDGLSPPIIPCNPVPPKLEPCSCCKPPTKSMALVLAMVANLLNLPKGSLTKLPLCSAKDVNLPPQILALTAPLPSNTENVQPQKQLTPAQIEALMRIFKTPQALAETITPTPNPPCFLLQNPNLIPRNPNIPPKFDFPNPNPNNPTQLPNFPPQLQPQVPNVPPRLPFFPPPPQCITHHVEPNIRPVVEECIRNVPVYQNTVRHMEEQTIRNIPVVEKTLTNQEEHIIRQVPVVRRITRPVVDTRTRHIPIIRKRIRTVVEPYTSHVPILEKFTRPVEEMFITSVPVVEKRCHPVFTQTVRHVPVTEKRIRPVVHSQITQVPVKKQVVRHFIEHTLRPCVVPCEHCDNPAPPHPCFPFPPTFLNVPGTPSFPCHM